MYNIFKIKKSKQENLIDELVKRSCDYLKTHSGFLNSSLEEQEPQCELPPGWKPKPQETVDYWKRDEYYWGNDEYQIAKGSSPVDYGVPQIYRASRPLTEYPKKMNALPSWVEMQNGFKASVWELGARHSTGTRIFLVAYEPLPMPSSMSIESPFVKIVFTDKQGNPFKQMANLVKALAKENKNEVDLHGVAVAKPYDLTLDGKVRDKIRCGVPNEFAVETLVDDLYVMYQKWWMFPEVEDFSLVVRLSSAWESIQRMEREEISKNIKGRINELREEIKKCQNKISELEKDENKIYEDAADGMNLLEGNGIDVDELKNREVHDVCVSTLSEFVNQIKNASWSENYALAP